MRAASVLILFIWCCLPVDAQDLLEYKVKALFEDKTEAVQVDFFHGRMDAMQEVGIAMACDQKDCRGVLRYLRSKEELILKGSIRKDKVVFNEINNFGKISGHIEAKLKDDQLIGWWSSSNEAAYFSFELDQVEKMPSNATPCGKDKWIRHLTTADADTKMLVQKIDDQNLTGNLYLGKKVPGYQLSGAITSAGYYELDIYELDEKVGTLISGFNDQERQKIIFNWINKEGREENFSQTDKFVFGCVEHGDFLGNYSMTYPLTRHESFNEWIQEQVSDFVSRSKKYGQEVRKENPRLDPKLRATLNAIGWTEINYYNEKIISGVINFSQNWSSDNKTVAFIFDLEKGTLYDQRKIVQENDALDLLMSNEKEALKKNQSNNKSYCKWLDSQTFDLINIQHNGISFESIFHPIFGKEKIVIPFDKVSPYLLPVGALTAAMD